MKFTPEQFEAGFGMTNVDRKHRHESDSEYWMVERAAEIAQDLYDKKLKTQVKLFFSGSVIGRYSTVRESGMTHQGYLTHIKKVENDE